MRIDDLNQDEQAALHTAWHAAPTPVLGAELNGLGSQLLVKGWLSKPPAGLKGDVFQLASDEVRWLVANRWPKN